MSITDTEILARVPLGTLFLTINLALFLPHISNIPYANAGSG